MPPITLSTRTAPSDAARAFLMKACTRPLLAQGLSHTEATATVLTRYPWLEAAPPSGAVSIRKHEQEPSLSAWQEITTLAETMVAKGAAPTLAQAIDRVVTDRPDLYQRSRVELPPDLPAPRQPAPVTKSAYQDCLETMAKRYVAEGSAPTMEQAFAQACDNRPDLLAMALQSERQARR